MRVEPADGSLPPSPAARRIRFVGAWEVFGGLWALGVLIVARPTIDFDVELVFLAFIACIAVASIVAGVGLLRNLDFGRAASIVVQAAQCVHLALGILSFRVILGPFVLLGWSSEATLRFYMGATAEGRIGFNQPPPYGVTVNLVAIAWLLMLVQAETRPARMPATAAAPPA